MTEAGRGNYGNLVSPGARQGKRATNNRPDPGNKVTFRTRFGLLDLGNWVGRTGFKRLELGSKPGF